MSAWGVDDNAWGVSVGGNAWATEVEEAEASGEKLGPQEEPGPAKWVPRRGIPQAEAFPSLGKPTEESFPTLGGALTQVTPRWPVLTLNLTETAVVDACLHTWPLLSF